MYIYFVTGNLRYFFCVIYNMPKTSVNVSYKVWGSKRSFVKFQAHAPNPSKLFSSFFCCLSKNFKKTTSKGSKSATNEKIRKEAATVMAANNICVICLPNYNVGKNSLPDAEARNSANLAHMQTMTQIPICKSAGQQAIASLPITTNHYFSEHQSYAISMLTMILRLEVC